MRRAWKILITLAVVVAILLGVNAVIVDGETKPAVVNAPDGKIVKLSSVDLQLVDRPATGPGPEGAPIVLLHCYACSLRWWDQLVPSLNRSHRVITLDLIGFGGSKKPGSGYSISDQARAVAEALNGLGVEAAVVVGHSMGGLVATALAQNSSQLVDRVAVIATPSSIGDDGSLPWLARLGYTPVLGQAIWRLKPASMVRKQYERAFAPGFDYEAAFDDPDQVLADTEAMTYTSYKQAAAESEEFTDEVSVSARITDAAVPFMAILGDEDQITDTDAAAEAYRAIPGAEVDVLGGVGHSAELEAPERTAKLITGFAKDAPAPVAVESAKSPPKQPSRSKPAPPKQGKRGGNQRGPGKGEPAKRGSGSGPGKPATAKSSPAKGSN